MKRVVIVILAVLLIGVGYLAYDKFLAEDEINPWQFVPSKAAIIFEGSQTLALYDSLKNRQIWSAFASLPEIQDWDKKLSELDSVTDVPINQLFGDNDIKIAVFPVSATKLDALFIMRIISGDQRSFLKKIKTKWEVQGYRSKERLYNGFTIEEFYQRPDGPMFSLINHGDLLVGSYTPFLVEDAIRAFNEPEKLGFVAKEAEVFKLKPLDRDQGNVYINLDEFGEMARLFSDRMLNGYTGNAFLDLSISENSIKFSGFTMPAGGALSSFNTAPEAFNLLDVVPDNVAILRHYSFTNAKDWRANLKSVDKVIGRNTDELKRLYDLELDFLFDQVANEVAIADLEAVGSDQADRLLFLDLSNVGEARQFMNLAASRTARDSVFQDQIGEYQIRKVDAKEISQAILGESADLDGDAYFLFYRSYLVLSNSIAELKKLIRSIENDNTWRKSIRINQLLDISSREANYSLIVNVPRFWNQLTRSMSPEWRTFFQSNETGFKSLEHFALQFNLVEDKFYTSAVAIQSNPPRQPGKTQVADQATFPFKIITKPFIHRSHINQALEVLLQDSSYQLYHLDADLDILWTLRLSAPISGPIEAVDYYRNGKKQYAFVAGSLLHIIDRTGKELDGFPKAIPNTKPIKYFSVVDYDGSKNYRFMCTDQTGKIYLLDKAGNALQGWNPNQNKEQLTVAPMHIRIAGRDAFILMTKDAVDLKTRRGGSYDGFPIKFTENLEPAYFTEATGAFNTSKLTAVSETGEILRINYSGQIEFRDQLFKPSLSTTFDLIPDVLDNTYLITRYSRDEWEVLDGSGNVLFKKTYLGNPPDDVKFYRFGGDNTLLTVFNPESKLISVYDLKGNALTPSGLASMNPVSIIHYENLGFYEFYLASDNRLQKVRLR